jgi:CheY-like chemotaxis protein
MTTRCALLIDGDLDFAQSARSWLEGHDLELVRWAAWSDDRFAEVAPAVIFVAVDLPDKTGFVACRRARERARGVPIVLTTATIPPDEFELNRQAELAAACVDERTPLW